jgi:hypothetical protein
MSLIGSSLPVPDLQCAPPSRGGPHPRTARCPSALVVTVIGALMAVTSCGGAAKGQSQTSAPAPVSRPTAKLTLPTGQTPLRRSDLATIDRGTAEVTQLALASPIVTWVEAPQSDHLGTVVMAYDLATGRVRRLASAPPGGEVDSPRPSVHGDTYVVYTELSRIPSDADHRAAWRLVLADLQGNSTVTLAEDRNGQFVEQIPGGKFVGHWCVWAAADSTNDLGSRTIFAYDLDTGKRRTVITGVHPSNDPGGWAEETIFDDRVGSGTDVIEQPIAGGERTVLTKSGHAILAVAANGGVAWQEPESGDPTSEWYLRPGGRPSQIAASRGGNAFPGSHIVVWLGDEEVLMAASIDGTKILALQRDHLDIGGRWWIDADTVVWATLSDDLRDTIHVATISP